MSHNTSMLLADAQVHTWLRGTPPSVHQQKPFTNDDLLSAMDEAGVDRAILVPPNWDPSALAHANKGALRHPARFAVMAGLPLEDTDCPGLLPHVIQAGVLGLRLTFATEQRRAMLAGHALDWLWSEVEDRRIPVMIAIWGRLSLAVPLVERYPGLRLIIDHLGIPVTDRTVDEDAFSDMDAVLDLARFPNVAVKASGLPAHSTLPYPFRNLHPYLRRVYDAYGPERTFWGTDLTRMPCSYQQCITMFTDHLSWLSAGDLDLVMGAALCRWIGWDAGPRGDDRPHREGGHIAASDTSLNSGRPSRLAS